MRNKILCLCLSLFMVVSYLPASVMTAFAAPIDNLETNEEDTSPKLILDKESNIKDVFVYKILDGSEYEKDAFGLISYTDSFKNDSESSKEFLEVDDFYSKLLDLFKDIKDLEDVDKKSSSNSKEESEKVEKEVTQEDINKESLELYDEISEFLDESKQLQFNKDRELTDLTEGVYLIFSENMYPQFVNITNSDEDVNIKLEENKSANEDAQKDIEDKVTPKASPKKSGPLKIASPDTEGLATDVEINKFDLTLTNGPGQFKTIDGQQVYVITKSEAYNTSTFNWKLEYALSATGSYPAESVEIRIPRYYYSRLNYDNSEELYTSSSVVPSVPAYPNYNTSGFAYKFDSETNEYVITNVVEIPGGSSGFFEFEYDVSSNTTRIKDETLQIPLKATINVQTGDEGLKTQNSEEINWMYDTAVEAKEISELLNNKYDTWQESWGPAPSNADDYFYVTYAFSGKIGKPSGYPGSGPTQAYNVQIENSGWSNDFVYGWINFHNSVITDSSTGVKYSSIPYSYENPLNPSTYKSIYNDSNIVKFDSTNINDGVLYTGYSNTTAWYDGIVLARYPKSLQQSDEYDVTNTITMTIHPANGNDEDSTVTYTRTDTLKNISFERPEGRFNISKSQSNSPNYVLSSMLKGKPVAGFWYRPYFMASNYDKTVTPGQSLDDPNNYGKVPVHYEFIDDTLFLSNDSEPLGLGDYEFTNIYTGNLKLYDYQADNASGSYVSQPLSVGNDKYKNFLESGNFACWGKYEDGWHKLATLGFINDSTVGWTIEDSTLVSSKGSNLTYSSSNSSMYLELPYLALAENTNCLGYKFTFDTTLYQVELGTASSSSSWISGNSCVKLLGSNRVKTWAQTYGGSDTSYLYNVNTLLAKDSNNTVLGFEGEFNARYNDMANVKSSIDTLDNNLANTTLSHGFTRIKIEPKRVDSSIYKTRSSSTNDTLNEVYKQTYAIYADDEVRGISIDEFVDNPNTSQAIEEDVDQYLIDNDYINTSTGCIFYDLLPKGMVVDESTISVLCGKNYYNNYDYGLYPNSSGFPNGNSYEILTPENYTYELISNYKDSGRTLFKVTVNKSAGVLLGRDGSGARRYGLKFTGIYSWDSFFDYGTTIRNLVGFELGADSIPNGKPDNGDYSNFTSEEKEIMSDLDPNSDNPNFIYHYNSYRITSGVSGSSGLYKRVKGSSGDFEKDSMVTPQSTYQYKIRYAAESGTRCSDLIFYDSLENYTPDNFTGDRWRGKLQSLDISQLRDKGVNPKIYYSSTNNLNIENNQDLTNSSIWTPAEDWGNDLSNVKAFAIDCREKSNGESFVLGEKESLAIIVNMLSDVSNPNELYENETKAYNNIYAYNKVEAIGTNQTTEGLIHQNYTSIGITVPTTKVSGKKTWKDETTSTRPESIVVELLRNGVPYREQTITADDNWKFEFTNLLKQDNNLVDYEYTVREKTAPTGYTPTVEPARAGGTAITFGNNFDTETTCDYLKIYYKDENDQIRLLTGQGAYGTSGFCGSGTNMANKTVYVPSNDIYFYWYTDSSAVRYGFDIVNIEFTSVDPETITSSSSTVPTGPTPIEVTDESNYPKTAHSYTNNERILWHYEGTGTGNSDLPAIPNKYVITNKQTSKSISGQKIWSGDTQSVRPENITVKLLRNGEEYQSKPVTAANNWQYTFNNLPVFDENDNLYHYTIAEDSIRGYITRYSNGETTVETPTEGYNDIENIWNPRVITITKQWTNTKGGDDTEFRPENITVHLKRKQNPLQKIGNLFRTQVIDEQHTLELEYITDPTKWVKDGNTWTYTFSIPENEYNWEVYEEAIEYYNESNLIVNPADVNENSVTITNDFEPQIEIKGEKIWSGNDENYRPESITVNLHRNNQIIDTKTVSANDEWKYSFGYLPIYDNLGNEYTYSLSENSLDDYISTIDDISVGYSSYAITFGDRFATESTSYDWVSIYYVDEDNNLKLLTGQGSNNGKWGGSQTSANSLAGKTIYVPSNVFYVYWRSDNSNVAYGFDVVNIEPSSIPNNVTITSNSITSLPINESNAVLITSDNLPATAHDYGNNTAKLWKFDSPAAANGFNITNTLNKKTITGTKTWVGDSPENRPESITLNLYQDGTKIAETTTDASKNWIYTFENMPIYHEDGITEYEYYVTEDPVENYYIPEPVKGTAITFGSNFNTQNNLDFLKILYLDENNNLKWLIGQGTNTSGAAKGLFYGGSGAPCPAGKTIYVPSNKVYLYWETNGSGTAYGFDITSMTEAEIPSNIIITSEDATLPEYEPIEVTENQLPATSHNYTNSDHKLWYYDRPLTSLDVTNVYNLKNIEGTKTWIGDTASNRPENITVKLYQDGRKIAETTTDASKNWKYIFENMPIYKDNGITKYEYYVEEEPVENYFTNYDKSHAGVRVTFGNDLSITNSNAFMTILYKDSAGTWTRLIGQGSSNTGQWNSSNINSLKNTTIEIPSLEFYITWHGINTNQKWNVTNIKVCDDISIQEQILGTYSTVDALKRAYGQATEVEINSDNLPVAPYNSNYEVLYHFNGTNDYKSVNLVNEYNLFNIAGTVNWEGDWDNKGMRPETVTLDLYQNGELFATQELPINSDNTQNFEFNNIPRLDENGNEYQYVVHQRDIDNYNTSNIDDLNILNVCNKRNVTGYKIWVNDEGRNSRPDSIKVILYDGNNNKIAEKVVTSDDEIRDNCWAYTFENVPVFDDNNHIIYYHVEEEISTKEYYTGYIPNQWYKYSTENEYLINSSAQEIWQSRQELPPNISDELFDSWFDYLADNNIPLQIGEWNNLTSEYQELFTEWFNTYRDEMLANYFDDNHLYGYNYELNTQKKAQVFSDELTSIVNVYRLKHIDGIKHWKDEGSQYQRPNSVTLGLYRNGEKIDEQVITAENGWKYSFVDLPEVDSTGTPYEYNIKEEDLENYITEYNPGDVTEGVQVTFDLPLNSIYRSASSNWQQNNIYDNFSPLYGLVAVFKDGNTWYRMTLEEFKQASSSGGGGEYYEKSAKAAIGPGSLGSGSSGITFIIPSKEFYVIPIFRYTANSIIVESVKSGNVKGIGDLLVPSLKSYKTVKLTDGDKAKLDYVRSVSKVEFTASPFIDTFGYHMYNNNEYGVLFEKLGSSFDINDEADHVIELRTADLPDFLDEYITNKDTSDYDIESWIHRVAFHYNEELGLTNYPLDAKTSYSGTKIWNNNIVEDDATDSPSCFDNGGGVAKAMSKVNKLTIKAATQVTQPESVTVVLLQDGHQYATQTIGEDTNWKFEFDDLPMFDPSDHHKYEYSIKEKSVKGYKTEVLPDEETNGHQVIISSDIPMNLSRAIYILCRYNGQWYACDSLPDDWSYSNINNKLKVYIPGDDFKILVRSNYKSQNNIYLDVQDAIANGQNPENYIKIDSIKAVNIPYEIHDYGDYMYYQTMNQWNYYWDAVNVDDLPVPEYTTINVTDGSTHTITIDQALTGYDNTNPDEQYNEFYNLYQYTSNVTSGIKIINTYYEGSFKIKKVDEQGRILPGCEFSLFYANSDGDTWTKAETDPTAVSLSDDNGMVSFENIPYGDYLLYETKPADGYRTPSKPWKVSINTNGSATIWDENGKLVPIQGSDKEYDMTNGVKITFNEDTDMPYGTLFIIAKNEQNNSAVIYGLNGPYSNTHSKKSIIIPSKDFYIGFMNENGDRGTDTKSAPKLFSLFDSKSGNSLPYGFKVEKVEPIETNWNDIYNNNYFIQYDSYDYDGITWDQFFNNFSDMIDVIECDNYPESAHYEGFMEYLNKDKSTAWHYDASNIISSIDEFDNDALFEGSIITFGDNNHASVVNPINNDEQYFNNPILAFEYHNQYYLIMLPKNPAELNNISIKVPSNNIWLMMNGRYISIPPVDLRGSTVPSTGTNYGYDLGNEIVDVESITKSMMTKDDVQYALNSAMYQEPKSAESEFTPEFELTGEKQEIHWMTDQLGDNDAEEGVVYKSFYHYQNDAMGLIPIYEIANELTRTETILVNTEDETIPGGVLQIIDKDGNVVDSWSTTDEWHITWGLTEGEEYTIHQVSTPYPYRVAEDDTFTVLQGEITYVKVINDKVKDVTISKTVSGNGASTEDVFNYHVEITNGEHNVNHVVETPNGNLTLATDNTGSGSLDFTLKHNESIKIKGVYNGAVVTVTESANKYVASYQVDNVTRTINPTNNMDITSTITMGDADVSIAFENTVTMILPTGVYLKLKDILPFIMLGLCLAGIAVVYRKNKNKKLNLVK